MTLQYTFVIWPCSHFDSGLPNSYFWIRALPLTGVFGAHPFLPYQLLSELGSMMKCSGSYSSLCVTRLSLQSLWSGAGLCPLTPSPIRCPGKSLHQGVGITAELWGWNAALQTVVLSLLTLYCLLQPEAWLLMPSWVPLFYRVFPPANLLSSTSGRNSLRFSTPASQ